MPTEPPDELAWSHDPSLSDEQRWHAFKAWKAMKRVEFTGSARAREEHAAWQLREPEMGISMICKPARQKPRVYPIS
jgi:hypothetical protein